MKTSKEYFSHDYGSRNDPKLVNVLMKHGQAGIGTYWCLIEMIYEQGGRLRLDECESYAFALHSDSKLIQSLLGSFELFEHDETFFWSKSVNNRLDIRKSKSEKASFSAHKRWKNADALQPQSESNAIKGKESKVKERKEDTAEREILFQTFWDLYGKKRDRESCLGVWKKMSQTEIDACLAYTPKYTKESPDIKYRKDPIRFLKKKCWNDQLVSEPQKIVIGPLVNPTHYFSYEDYRSACAKKNVDPLTEEAYINAGKGIKTPITV